MEQDRGSVIGPTMTIRGNVRCETPVRVEGRLEGSFQGVELVIAEDATVIGTTVAKSIDCSGRLEGETSSQAVFLRKTAFHRGTVATTSLSVEPGAVLDCALHSGKEAELSFTETKPDPTSSPAMLDNQVGGSNLDLSGLLSAFAEDCRPSCMDVPWSERGQLFQVVGELLAREKPILKIVGDPGSGKTDFVEKLSRDLPENFHVLKLEKNTGSVHDILQEVARGLELDPLPNSQREILDRIAEHLRDNFRRNIRVILLVDDVQDMFPASLEGMVRLLTDSFEEREGSLQIVLVGTPAMDELLVETIVEYFEDETNCQLELAPLGVKDCAEYLRLWLQKCASDEFPVDALLSLFPFETIKVLHSRSGGNLRQINSLAAKGIARANQLTANQITPSMLA